MNKLNIAIFASGSGTNAENIAKYFETHDRINIALILSNNSKAKVLDRAANLGIPSEVFNRSDFYEHHRVMEILDLYHIDFIVLAGFLWLVPGEMIKKFERKILNIHPALLPGYGGRGMYGKYVHEAVKMNKERLTGISIHYVNEHYDEGDIVFQARCSIDPDYESAEEIAGKVHALEYKHYPEIIEKTVLKEFAK